MRRPLITGESLDWEEFVFQRADGSFGTFLMGAAPVESGSQGERMAVCTFTDITDRKQMEKQMRRIHDELEERVEERAEELKETNRALQREVDRRRRVQSRMRFRNRLLRLFQSETSLQDYLQAVVELINDITGCRKVGVRLREEDGHIPYQSAVGFDEDFIRSECWLDPARHRCVCSRVVEQRLLPHEKRATTRRGSFWTNDSCLFWQKFPEEKRDYYRARCIEEGLRTLAVVPIRRGDDVIGGLHIADPEKEQLSEDEVKFLESITPFIWEAVHRFQMEERLDGYREELRSLASQVTMAEERERRRIATELHDSVAQTLALSKMKLSALQQQLKQTDAKDAADEVKRHLDSCIKQTRSLTFELSPPILYEVGLEPALEQLADRMEEDYDLSVDFHDDGSEKSVEEDRRVMLFRSVRELLLNVVKHADADRVEVAVRRDGSDVFVRVEDDGVGFEPSETGPGMGSEGGFGLFDVRERLNQMGGNLTLHSEPGKGTVATLSAPMEKE